MEIWLWAAIGVMATIIVVLFVKIYTLQKSAKEIKNAFADRLMTETNTLIDISSNDNYMRELAASINIQLRKLREERHFFIEGNAELKNAVTNISHDLRTPLTAICGYLDLLEQEEKSTTIERYIEIIRNRADLLTELIEELFRYSVIISGERLVVREPIAINGILEESIAAFYTTLNKRGIVPNIKITQAKIVRSLDRSSLIRVFSNLLNNAIKYSDGDLDITLTDSGEVIFANTASRLNEVQVGKLFDRFYTVEAARKSTGLGLAIARTLIEQMNGTISAKYENGRLSICIFFPDISHTET
jgi:signal transduction histidine kinase